MINGRRFKKVHAALAYAAVHRDEDVSLQTLARQSGFSAFHLHRIFGSITGETPKHFTRRIRLERAAAMLLTSSGSVLEVALMCGFQSHEVFIRTFRQRFGMTPSAYRVRGFAGGADALQAKEHEALVNRAGPCIGLYHLDENLKSEGDVMAYAITKRQLTPQPVLLVRKRVKRSDIAATIGAALPHVFQYAQQQGIALSGHPFTRYADVGAGLMTIEPGMMVAKSGQDPVTIDPGWTTASGDTEVLREVLPGGPAACTTHNGPYEQLPDAYAALQAWMEKEHLVPAGAPWEYYVTDPAEVPDPKDWKTDVFWPVVSTATSA